MDFSKAQYIAKIVDADVFDVRFPTSLTQDGSDATHIDPDYSCAYVIIRTDAAITGHGFTFTIGRGTEIVVKAIESIVSALVKGKTLKRIYEDFGSFWQSITNESQLRWLGPEKGVIHLATAAVVNALWDLWAKIENKPLWRLLVDMEPKQLVSTIDFHYITDVITPEEALAILERNAAGKAQRVDELLKDGMPAYITSVGWMGYSNEKIRMLCDKALADGWTRFKMKVGNNLEEDRGRAGLIREAIGKDNCLMMDANQRWDVPQAIAFMQGLVEFKPLWIEEPTSPDDVLGHAAIAQALRPLGVGVATGEHCQNRVMFKQFLRAGGMQFCQIDACRMGGVNEVLSVLLMAAKCGVPVCPHAGGVGLCELVQHLAAFNYACVSPSWNNVMVEFADHLHAHFIDPAKASGGRYVVPKVPGYGEMKSESLQAYSYPKGPAWQNLFDQGKFSRPEYA